MRNSFFAVEGSHDAAFFGHLLKARGYKRAQYLREVPEFWQKLIPDKYPVDELGSLSKTVRFPEFFFDEAHESWVAIALAGGQNKLIETIRVPIEVHSVHDFSAFAVVLDADWEHCCAERFSRFHDRLVAWRRTARLEIEGFDISFPVTAGGVVDGPPKFGVYLFPDNAQQGTLESVLINCAGNIFPTLHGDAAQLLSRLPATTELSPSELKKINSPAGRDKAHAGIIGTVLQPGASLAVSLINSKWIADAEARNPAVAQAGAFLDSLLSV